MPTVIIICQHTASRTANSEIWLFPGQYILVFVPASVFLPVQSSNFEFHVAAI